jgi:antitoxin FitA
MRRLVRSMMGQLTVRKVDDEIIRRLKIQAAEHGRSAEAEHREILKQALLGQAAAEDFWTLARRLREETGPVPGDSADIIRKMRDER